MQVAMRINNLPWICFPFLWKLDIVGNLLITQIGFSICPVRDSLQLSRTQCQLFILLIEQQDGEFVVTTLEHRFNKW